MYKVENIGDTYCAVCGVPEERRDHAVAMVRFAMDVRTKMQVLTRQLMDRLGQGTDQLRVRIGIHSGSVVAGILRGQRAQSFKLLSGDTVHMAVAMMEKGKGNQIHVSMETAQWIIDAGKERWLRQSETMLEVPNKGQVQTFWIKDEALESKAKVVRTQKRQGE